MWLLISNEARQRGLAELERVHRERKRAGHRELAGYIAETVIAEHLDKYGAKLGGPFEPDILMPSGLRFEVKNQTCLKVYTGPRANVWSSRYKPDAQDATIYCMFPLQMHSIEAVLKADMLLVLGWIADKHAKNCTLLKKGDPVPNRSEFFDSDTLVVPQSQLHSMSVLEQVLQKRVAAHD